MTIFPADESPSTPVDIKAFRTDSVYRKRYDSFVSIMVYGERWKYDDVLQTVADLVDELTL